MMAKVYPNLAVDFTLDPVILAFVAAVSVAAGLAFGVLPAWHATKTSAGETIKEQSRGAIGAHGQLRSGRLLVAFQLALSLPLLVGAGLLVRTVSNLQAVDLGFPSGRLLLVRVDFREAVPEPQRRDRLIRDVQQQFQAVPGVTAVSFSQLGIFSGGESSASIEIEGYVPKSDDDRGSAVDVVGPGYFAALGIPLLQGRDISTSDGPGTPLVCVINEAFAARFFDGRNPIGLHVRTTAEDGAARFQIVGVAKNARTQSLRDGIDPRFYVAAGQRRGYERPTYLVRTSSATAATVLPALRGAVERVDAALPILSARPLEDQMAPLVAQDRTTAQLALVFGGVALMLASIGLYGVLSYGIARRANEIAIRIALGAPPARVIGMILRETGHVVAGGLLAGGALAYAGSRLIGSRLYGVAPEDPLTLAAATGLLLLVALSAAYLPARRASRVDPMLALHS
jgi:predicted permease